MIKFNLIFSFFLLHNLFSSGQEVSYDISSIPESLKKNASIVKRYENIVLDIESPSKATLFIQKIVTVLNEDGDDALFFNVYSNKFVTLADAEIKVSDSKGKQISKIKRKDMVTQAMGEGLIEDGVVTMYSVDVSTYPITVEFRYEIKFNGLLNLPEYRISTHGESVEQSNFTAKVAASTSLRFKPKNIEIKPIESNDGKFYIYKWSVNNLPAYEYEEGAVSYFDRYPYIRFALNKFSLDGYDGDLSSWNSFGEWLGKLYKGTDVLPATRKSFFSDMVKDASTDKEKARLIYQYLQKNFRYVSIQLGIGGFKPFSAEFTDQKKYGDCKSLSNYMKAALSTVGIKSHLVIINSGYNDEPADPEFPSNSFNHVILCIPQQKDSIWLECTSSTTSFAELGTFTENRYALLVTDDGGKLVSTPVSDPKSNTKTARTVVKLEDDGSGTSETIFRSKGSFREQMDFIAKEKKQDQKESLVFLLSFKQPDDFEFVHKEDEEIYTTVLKMEIEKVPEFSSGSKIFLAPRLYKFWSKKLPKAENRRLDFYFKQPFEMADTTVYQLAEGYSVDVLPKIKELKCEYGTYKSEYWFDEKLNTVNSAAKLVLKQHKIPAANYPAVKIFFDEVLKEESQRIIIKKQ